MDIYTLKIYFKWRLEWTQMLTTLKTMNTIDDEDDEATLLAGQL